MKNKLLKEHFLNPCNIGTIEGSKYNSIVKSEICNDIVKMSADIDPDGKINDIKVQVYGCGYSISGASLISENSIGKNINELTEQSHQKLENSLTDLTDKNKTCALLAQKALLEIIKKYQTGK